MNEETRWTTINDMNKDELAAYDCGCSEMMGALQKILEGKDDGAGTSNPPWEPLRRSVLRLVGEAREARNVLALALDPKHRRGASLVADVRTLIEERDLLARRLDWLEEFIQATEIGGEIYPIGELSEEVHGVDGWTVGAFHGATFRDAIDAGIRATQEKTT
jgi:hypothetical protein